MTTFRTRTAVAVTSALLLAACGGTETPTSSSSETTNPSDTSSVTDAPPADTEADTLVVYSGRSESLVGPIIEDFEAATGIDVEVRYGDNAELALLLEQEGDATDADIFLAQSPGAVAFAESQGLLAPLGEDLVGLAADGFVGSNETWVGVTGRVRVLVYNEDLVDEADLPASVLDLTDEEWKGRFAIAPNNGSFQDWFSALRLTIGEDAAGAWLDGIAANEVATYPKNSAIVDAVARGEVEMGLVNHYYNLRRLAEEPDAPSTNHFFADGDIGGLVLPSTVSIVAGTDARSKADSFVTYLLGAEAQAAFATESFEYPLTAGVAQDAQLPSLADLDTPTVDFDQLGADLESTAKMIADRGLSG